MVGHKKLFCFGYGYTCDYIGHALQQDGWAIAGTTRDSDKQLMLQARDIETFIFDYALPVHDVAGQLRDVTHILISTPPGDDGCPTFNIHGRDIASLPNLEWIGYLSTTGVYGNRDGEWVDEEVRPNPTSKRGSRRLQAERDWHKLSEQHNLPLHTFRLSGIYGPGRSALDSVRVGTARRIDKPGHAFNRIHVEDIVNVLIASIEKSNPFNIYNVADDNPAPSHEVIKYACELLGYLVPDLIPFEEAHMAPMVRSFYKDNKRIQNEKIKNDLGVVLKYPDFKSGLDGCLNAEEHAGVKP